MDWYVATEQVGCLLEEAGVVWGERDQSSSFWVRAARSGWWCG
jgi:hypothetical protein